MNKKVTVLLVASLLLVPLFAHSVQGANIIGGLFETLFGTAPDTLDIAKIYENYHTVIDFALLAFLFASVSRRPFRDLFGEKETRMLSFVIALVLAFGGTWWMEQQGFNLGMLGPLAVAVLLTVIGVAIFNVMHDLLRGNAQQRVGISTAVAYILVYMSMKGAAPGIFEWLDENVGIIGAILEILFLVALIYLIIGIIKIVQHIFRNLPNFRKSGTTPGGGGTTAGGGTTTGGGALGGGPAGGGPAGGGQGGPQIVRIPTDATRSGNYIAGLSSGTFAYDLLFDPQHPKTKLDNVVTTVQLIETNIQTIRGYMATDQTFQQRNTGYLQNVVNWCGEAKNDVNWFKDSTRTSLKNRFSAEGAKLTPPIQPVSRGKDMSTIMSKVKTLQAGMDKVQAHYTDYCAKINLIRRELNKIK